MSLVLPERRLKPLIVTYDELVKILYPIAMGNNWSVGCIRDLWNLGVPTPQSRIGSSTEHRIILPKQLGKWLETTLTENGHPLDRGARAYMDLLDLSNGFA